MLEKYEIAKGILEKYHQGHLLNFYDELNNDEKDFLLNQILNTDFKKILSLYEASKIDEVIPHNVIEPLLYYVKSQFSDDEIAYYEKIGEDAILSKKCAVVTLARRSRHKAWLSWS